MHKLELEQGLVFTTVAPDALPTVPSQTLIDFTATQARRKRRYSKKGTTTIDAKPNGMTYVEPILKERKSRRTALLQVATEHALQTPSTWSGAVTPAPSGQRFVAVQGTWTVPSVTPPAGATDGDHFCASVWIGLDGKGGSSDILQAGCDADVTLDSGVLTYQYQLWIEWYPAGSVVITNIPVSAGDLVDCSISLTGEASTDAIVSISNQTTGCESTGIHVTAPQGTALTGNCADWIVEGFGGLGPLANFSSVNFSNCSARSSDGNAVGVGQDDAINMTATDGAILSSGSVTATNQIRVAYA